MNKLSTMKMETRRLILRNMKVEDVTEDYVDWLNDPNINQYLNTIDSIQTIETCLSYVKNYEEKNDSLLIGLFDIDRKLHIGNISLSVEEWRKRGVIGICIGRKEFTGKKLASEALTAVRDYCFEELGLHRLEAGVSENNLSSIKVFLNVGFKKEGVLRDSTVVEGKFQNACVLGMLDSDR